MLINTTFVCQKQPMNQWKTPIKYGKISYTVIIKNNLKMYTSLDHFMCL